MAPIIPEDPEELLELDRAVAVVVGLLEQLLEEARPHPVAHPREAVLQFGPTSFTSLVPVELIEDEPQLLYLAWFYFSPGIVP